MTSNTITPNQKIFKTVLDILFKVFLVLTVVMAFLNLFTPVDATRQVVEFALLIAFAVCFIATIVVGKVMSGKVKGWNGYRNEKLSKVHIVTVLVLVVMLVVVVMPFYIIAINSIKLPAEVNNVAFTWFPQKGVTFDAYTEIFTYDEVGVSIIGGLLNTIEYAILPLTLGIFSSSLSAYGFSKLKFVGKDLMFTILLMTMMLPGCVTLTTTYVLYDMLGWVNSPLPLIIPGCFGSIGTVFFLREYYNGIPNDLLEAAKIDGAGKMKSFFSVMLPLGKTAILTQLILGFIGIYNDYLGPLMYLNDSELYTLQVALRFFDDGVTSNSLLAAGCMLGIIPMLGIYAILNKQIVSSISISSGLKG